MLKLLFVVAPVAIIGGMKVSSVNRRGGGRLRSGVSGFAGLRGYGLYRR